MFERAIDLRWPRYHESGDNDAIFDPNIYSAQPKASLYVREWMRIV